MAAINAKSSVANVTAAWHEVTPACGQRAGRRNRTKAAFNNGEGPGLLSSGRCSDQGRQPIRSAQHRPDPSRVVQRASPLGKCQGVRSMCCQLAEGAPGHVIGTWELGGSLRNTAQLWTAQVFFSWCLFRCAVPRRRLSTRSWPIHYSHPWRHWFGLEWGPCEPGECFNLTILGLRRHISSQKSNFLGSSLQRSKNCPWLKLWIGSAMVMFNLLQSHPDMSCR
jgi:hypothetical protein